MRIGTSGAFGPHSPEHPITVTVNTSVTRHGGIGTTLERWVERHLRVLMLAPAMIVLAGLTLFPTLYMFRAALTRISPNPEIPWEFVGLDNFQRLLTDPQFHVGLWNTIVFGLEADIITLRSVGLYAYPYGGLSSLLIRIFPLEAVSGTKGSIESIKTQGFSLVQSAART